MHLLLLIMLHGMTHLDWQLSQFFAPQVTVVTFTHAKCLSPLRHTMRPQTPMDTCGHTSACARPNPQASIGLSLGVSRGVCMLFGTQLFDTLHSGKLYIAITLLSCRCQLSPTAPDLHTLPVFPALLPSAICHPSSYLVLTLLFSSLFHVSHLPLHSVWLQGSDLCCTSDRFP